jgi:hypothetical protein
MMPSFSATTNYGNLLISYYTTKNCSHQDGERFFVYTKPNIPTSRFLFNVFLTPDNCLRSLLSSKKILPTGRQVLGREEGGRFFARTKGFEFCPDVKRSFEEKFFLTISPVLTGRFRYRKD